MSFFPLHSSVDQPYMGADIILEDYGNLFGPTIS